MVLEKKENEVVGVYRECVCVGVLGPEMCVVVSIVLGTRLYVYGGGVRVEG